MNGERSFAPRRLSRRRVVGLGLGAVAAALAPRLGGLPFGTPAEAAEAPIPFVSPTLASLANWNLTAESADQTRYTLAPKGVEAFQGAPKRVLIPFAKPSPPFDGTLTKMLDVLYEKRVPVTLHLWHYKQKLDVLAAIIAFGEANRFDLLAPMGSEATQNVHDTYLNGPLPVLSLFTKDPVLQGWVKDYDKGSGTNLAYCSVAVPIDVQIAYMRQLNPGVTNIAVMYSSNSQSTIDAQVTPLKEAAGPEGITVFDVVVTDDNKPEPELSAQIPRAIEKMRASDPDLGKSVFWATGTTSVINSVDLISKIVGKVPVLASYPDMVKEGSGSAIMSVGIEYENVGYLAAASMLDILYNGARPGEMKIGVISPPDLAINFLKAHEIGAKIPFSFFENASYVYDDQGKIARKRGEAVAA